MNLDLCQGATLPAFATSDNAGIAGKATRRHTCDALCRMSEKCLNGWMNNEQRDIIHSTLYSIRPISQPEPKLTKLFCWS